MDSLECNLQIRLCFSKQTFLQDEENEVASDLWTDEVMPLNYNLLLHCKWCHPLYYKNLASYIIQPCSQLKDHQMSWTTGTSTFILVQPLSHLGQTNARDNVLLYL